MSVKEIKYSKKKIDAEWYTYTPNTNTKAGPCHNMKSILITVQKKKNLIRKKHDYTQPTAIFHLSNFLASKNRRQIINQNSMPETNRKNEHIIRSLKLKSKSCTAIIQKNCSPCSKKYLEPKQSLTYNLNSFINEKKPTFKVYRCQLSPNVAENCNNCCCSCNSDAMFEVMKDLYECYKKRNCDNCNCILCCHATTKSFSAVSKPYPKMNLDTALKEVAMRGFALPEGKTVSEKELIYNIRKVLGLPPEPVSQRMRDKYTNAANAGYMVPLEGKSLGEKEKILRDLNRLGIPLPVGRTLSEKLLVEKVGGKVPPHSKRVSQVFQKSKRSSILTTLEGKPHDQIEKILRELAMRGIPLPEGETASKAKLISKVRADLGLPPSPKTSDLRHKHANAAEDGILLPLEGKSSKEKERILKGLRERGIPLPKGRTQTEKALLDKILLETLSQRPTHKLGKSSEEQQEKKLRELAMKGIPLPEPKTESDKKLLKKVRADLGLPPEPKTHGMRNKYEKAANLRLLIPLNGKSLKEKEKILQDWANMGIPLPKGRTPSEEALVAKVKGEPRDLSLSKLKELEPSRIILALQGKSPNEFEKTLKKLARLGIPLPEGQTTSQNKIINNVRVDLGLPPEPKTPTMKEKHKKAAEQGFLMPLEGRSPEEKEIILQGQLRLGIPLPKGRTPSERAVIAKVRERHKLDQQTCNNLKESEGPVNECICKLLAPPTLISLDRKRQIKAAEQLLKGKTSDEKEKLLKAMANDGIPLPKGKSPSENKLILKVRNDLGLPPEPKTDAMKDKYEKAAEYDLLKPLQGHSPKEKERILRGLLDSEIPLPKPRTASEKSMIKKLQLEHNSPSAKIRRAKAAGLLTPLEGKTPLQKENILRGLAKAGIPLPKGKTDSENKLVNKVRTDLGLPPEPENSSMRIKYAKAADAGFLQPLEDRTPKEKEKILRGLHDLGIPLPQARSPSEKSLITRIQGKRPTLTPSEKIRGAKAAGLLTPLKSKTPVQRENILKGLAEHGMPLPVGESKSEKDMINKVRNEIGLPPEPKTLSMRDKYAKAADAGILEPLADKTQKEKEEILRRLNKVGLPLPKPRSASEKFLINKIKGEPRMLSKLTPSEKIRKAKSAGLLTPLKGKTPADIDRILRGLADLGISLPEGKTASKKNIINKARFDLGLPPEPKTPAMREKHEKAAETGVLLPLEGKSSKEKKKILQGLADMGIPLPVGRTDSEKKLIAKVKERNKLNLKPSKVSDTSTTTEKLRKAKVAGLLTPLETKSPVEKEKNLRNLVKMGLPLPEGKTRSEKALINQIKEDTGYITPSSSQIIRKAETAGLLPLNDSKTNSEKEKVLRQLEAAGIPLPEGKTPSEKEMIKKIKALKESKSSKMRAAKAAGLLTPLKNKTPEQKENLLRGLVKIGLPLPEGDTPSEKALIQKLRAEAGLPPMPRTPSMREKYNKLQDAGIITPLEGKKMIDKEKILKRLREEGILLPAGRTPSEKSLIKRIKAGLQESRPSLKEMTPAKKEKILRSLIKSGRSLPGAKTPSEVDLIKKVRKDMGLPPEPTTTSMKEKMQKAHSAGLITPLEGKTLPQKEKILRGLAEAGIPLPEGRTSSERALKRRIEDETRKKLHRQATKEITRDRVSQERGKATPKIQANKIKTAEQLGLMTPLEGKSLKEKERILKELAKLGLPLPDGTTPSDKQLIKNVRKNMGLPPNPETASMKKRQLKAANAGVLIPLEGLTEAEKEKVLRSQAKIGLPLPEGRTSSEKSLINKIKEDIALSKVPPETLQKAKTAGLLTPSKGKFKPEKEKIIRGRAKTGLLVPEGQTLSEKTLMKKNDSEFRLLPASKEAVRKTKGEGLFIPLASKTSSEKDKILHGLAEAEIPVPEGGTSKDRALMLKIKDTHEPKENKSGTKVPQSNLTTCERACGCDKKKIRFKHSYVKIKVTSPDISTLCPCPDECIPGVPRRVLVENQGINVIIESAVGIPQYRRFSKVMSENFEHDQRKINNLIAKPILFDIQNKNSNLINSIYENSNLTSTLNCQKAISQNYIFDIPAKNTVLNFSRNKICPAGKRENPSLESRFYYEQAHGSNRRMATGSSSQDSYDSIKILKCDTSLSFSSSYEGLSSSSIISFAASGFTTKSIAYLCSLSNIDSNNSAVVEAEFLTNEDECTIATNVSKEFAIQTTVDKSIDKKTLFKRNLMPDDALQVFPMSSTKPCPINKTTFNSHCKDNTEAPVIVITNVNSNLDLTTVVDDLIKEKEFCEISSLFVVIPTSDEEENDIRVTGSESAQYVQSSGNCNERKNAKPCTASKTQRKTKRQEHTLEHIPTTILSSLFCGGQGASPETSQDKPCCCGKTGTCDNVMCEVITPVYINKDPSVESVNFLIQRRNNIQQASFVSIIHSSALSVNRVSDYHPGCHSYQSPEKIQQNKFESQTSRYSKYLKKLLHRNLNSRTRNKILKEEDAGLDHRILDAKNNPPSKCLSEKSLTKPSVTPTNESYLICHQQKLTKIKPAKWTANIGKGVRLNTECDCNHSQPSFMRIKTESKKTSKRKTSSANSKRDRKYTEPVKRGPSVSIGVQDSPRCILCLSDLPCTSEHNISGHVTSVANGMSHRNPVSIYGHSKEQSVLSPLQSYTAMGSRRICSQKYYRPMPHRTNAGVGAEFKNAGTDGYRSSHSNKQNQKNSDVVYEYPSLRPKEFKRYIPRDYEEKQTNVLVMKPNLTQTTSRVQFDEKSLIKGPVQPSWTIEDLIRYYASFKPEVLKTLLSLTSINKEIVQNEEEVIKPKENQYIRGCVRGESSGVSYVPRKDSRIPLKEARTQESRPVTGFKIKKPGRNSSAKALSSINLDEVIQKPMPKKDITQQASFLSISTISRCEILPCTRHNSCHTPDQILQYPFGTPLSEPLKKLKKLVQLNVSPERVKYLFEQIEAGKIKDIDLDMVIKAENFQTYVDRIIESNLVPVPTTRNCQFPPCEGHAGCHSLDEVSQYPFGTPLPPNLVKLKELLERSCSRKKVKFLFEQIEAGNLNNIDIEDTSKIPTDSPIDICSSLDLGPTQKWNCQLPPCQEHPGCHPPDEILQFPFGTPLSPNLIELKKLAEENDCPKNIKQLYARIATRNRNVHWKEAEDSPTSCTSDIRPIIRSIPTTKRNCEVPPCQDQSNCQSPDDILIYPFGTPLSQEILNLKELIDQNDCPEKVKYLFSNIEAGKTNYVRSQPIDLESDDSTNSVSIPDLYGLEPLGAGFPQNLDEYTNLLEENSSSKEMDSDMDISSNNIGITSNLVPKTKTSSNCILSSYNLPDEHLQHPYDTNLLPHPVRRKELLDQNYNSQRVNDLFRKECKERFGNLHREKTMEERTSDVPYEYSNSEVISCLDPTYQNSDYHLPEEIIQYRYGIPLPQQLVELKTFLEQNSNPKEVKNLFGQIEAGNLKNLDWVEALNTESLPTISACQIPPCQGHPNCHSPDEISQYSFGTPLPEHLLKLKQLLEENHNPREVKELFKQIEAGKLEDHDCQYKRIQLSSSKPTKVCEMPPYQNRDDAYSLPPDLVQLNKLLKENCTPETVKLLIKQLQVGNWKNMKSVGCGETIGIPIVIAPDICPPSDSMSLQMPSSYMPPEPTPAPMFIKPGAFPSEATTPLIYPPRTSTTVLSPPLIPIFLPPEAYAPAPRNRDCPTCHKPKYRDGIIMKCACSSKKKTVKIKPCPCELHKVPISKEEPGLKIATFSRCAQCCICDDYSTGVKKSGKDVIFKLGQSSPSIIGTPGGPVSSGVQGGTGCIICPTGLPCSSEHTTCPKLTTITISPIPLGYFGQPDANTQMGELEIIGPQGGYVIIGPDGVYTQSGIKVIKFSTGTGTNPASDNVGAESSSKKKLKNNCVCSGKRGKKKGKVLCQCPSETDSEPLLIYTYDDFEEARKVSKQYKSDLTQTTSGFKFNKKKRPEPVPEPEYTVEDAIRDYAVIKPDFIRSLVPPGVTRKNKKNCACEEDVGVGEYEILKKDPKGAWEYANRKPVEPVKPEVPLKGLKISMGGKGSGSKGLSGICCFEMYQDS